MDDGGAAPPHGDDVGEFIAWVLTLRSWSAAWDVLRQRSDAGDFAFLGDVVVEAERHRPSDGGYLPSNLGSIHDFARALLAKSPTGSAAVELTRLASVGSDAALALQASHVASQQALDTAVQLFVGPAENAAVHRLRELLAQELLLRNPEAASDPVLTAWWASDRPADPLQWLPPVLADFEHDAVLQKYDLGGAFCAVPFGPYCDATNNVSATERPHRALAWQPQPEEPVRTARLAAPFDPFWKSETRAVRFDTPLGPDDVADALLSLGLDALAGIEHGPRMWCAQLTPHDVWEQMFAATANGGAYGSGDGAGIARLAAAQGMAALMGLPADGSFEDVVAAADASTWYRFDAQSDWYEQVAWDSGVACLAPDRRQLAVVAATDTD